MTTNQDNLYEKGKEFLAEAAKTNPAAELFLASLERDERHSPAQGLDEEVNSVDRGPMSDYRMFWRDLLVEDEEFDKAFDAAAAKIAKEGKKSG